MKTNFRLDTITFGVPFLENKNSGIFLHILRCVWDGEPCDVDDFKMRFTDVGVCFTFNHNKKKPLKVKNSGINRVSVYI